MLGRTKAALAGACALMFAGAIQAAPPTPVFLAKAGASDLYEKQSSQLVLSSHDTQVRDFAREMIRDHTKSTQMIKAAAFKSGLHPKPPVLDSGKRGALAELRRLHGAERDRKYLEQQRGAHDEALHLMQDYAATGSTPALRKAAGNIVPVVQHHMDMLNGIH